MASHREVSAERSPVTRSRTRFSIEEDDILLEVIHNAIENHEPWMGYEPYKRLANEVSTKIFLNILCLTMNSSPSGLMNRGETVP